MLGVCGTDIIQVDVVDLFTVIVVLETNNSGIQNV